ncbi:MAG: YbjQ family protein [Verrucomicrobiales bacterium]
MVEVIGRENIFLNSPRSPNLSTRKALLRGSGMAWNGRCGSPHLFRSGQGDLGGPLISQVGGNGEEVAGRKSCRSPALALSCWNESSSPAPSRFPIDCHHWQRDRRAHHHGLPGSGERDHRAFDRFGTGIVGGLRSIGGGNIPEYASVCEEAREQSYALLVRHARQMGADAVIAFRYDATEFMQSCTEVLAYGTAVKLARL